MLEIMKLVYLEIKSITPALLAAGVALYISRNVYINQKKIDRQTSNQLELRKANSEFLAQFTRVNSLTRRAPISPGDSDVEHALRADLYIKLQVLRIYAPSEIYSAANRLFEADQSLLTAERRKRSIAADSRGGLERALEKAEIDSTWAEEELRQAIPNYLEVLTRQHKEDLGLHS